MKYRHAFPFTELNVSQIRVAQTARELSQVEKREIERLKIVAIKPHWASDDLALVMAVDAIAAYGTASIPALLEISAATTSVARERANEWLANLKTDGPLETMPDEMRAQ